MTPNSLVYKTLIDTDPTFRRSRAREAIFDGDTVAKTLVIGSKALTLVQRVDSVFLAVTSAAYVGLKCLISVPQ